MRKEEEGGGALSSQEQYCQILRLKTYQVEPQKLLKVTNLKTIKIKQLPKPWLTYFNIIRPQKWP